MHVFFFYTTFAAKKKENNMNDMVNYVVHSYIIPPICGVFIQDIKGNLWKTEEWDGSVKPNAIAVIADKAKFLIALTQPSLMPISSGFGDSLEGYMTAIPSSEAAEADDDGEGNTARIMEMQPSTEYAAGYCNAFTFPDGKTRGYLPSLGQLRLAYQNKAAIATALSKCGGTAMNTSCYYWSSTFWGVNCSHRLCWLLYWSDGNVYYGSLFFGRCVRPFANF